MKQGSADDPFAEDVADGPDEGDGDQETTDEPATSAIGDEEPPADPTDDEPLEGESATDIRTASQQQSLPYIHARDGVKDGRTQRPIFLRDHVETGIDDLVAEMEAEIGEDVYKTDVTEAAMAVAEENPELVRAKLEEWGYGWT